MAPLPWPHTLVVGYERLVFTLLDGPDTFQVIEPMDRRGMIGRSHSIWAFFVRVEETCMPFIKA